MALKLMPGEIKVMSFTLPDNVADVSNCEVCFYQDDEKKVSYTEADTENLYKVDGEDYKIFVELPRADTLLFENKSPGKVQIEWGGTGFYKISKPMSISVGIYLNRSTEV